MLKSNGLDYDGQSNSPCRDLLQPLVYIVVGQLEMIATDKNLYVGAHNE